jgi:hypothetical protein
MPFDGQNYDTPALRRARLIEALRADMPEGFTWNFKTADKVSSCGTVGCAIGLARHRFGFGGRCAGNLGEAIGIGCESGWQIFGLDAVREVYGVPPNDVTPSMVADALERLGESAEPVPAQQERVRG